MQRRIHIFVLIIQIRKKPPISNLLMNFGMEFIKTEIPAKCIPCLFVSGTKELFHIGIWSNWDLIRSFPSGPSTTTTPAVISSSTTSKSGTSSTSSSSLVTIPNTFGEYGGSLDKVWFLPFSSLTFPTSSSPRRASFSRRKLTFWSWRWRRGWISSVPIPLRWNVGYKVFTWA